MSYIREVSWSEVRHDVAASSQELVAIIDAINPDNKLPLYKARYPYGSIIMDYPKGLNIPINKDLILPINDPKTPKNIQENLSYQPMPLGVITKNSIEIYKELDKKVFSVAFFHLGKGMELGIWDYFGWFAPYSVCSGARSVYMIPWISLAGSHKKIKKHFNIMCPAPSKTFDHWQLFKEISNSEEFNNPWLCEIVFFGKPWKDYIESEKSLEWTLLKNHILEKGWEHSSFGRKRIAFDFLWESTTQAMSARGIRSSAYTIDTLKHLISISLGGLSASIPFDGNDTCGPLTEIQKIYTDVYDLKEYIPTIMRPAAFDINKNIPVYYSLQTPTLLTSVPGIKSNTSNIDDMRELIELMAFFNQINFEDLMIGGIHLREQLSKIVYTFYHGDMYAFGKKIKPTYDLPKDDKNFTYSPISGESRKFADNGAFIRGCVKISKK